MFPNGHRLARSVFALMAAGLFAIFGGGGAEDADVTVNATPVPGQLTQITADEQRAAAKPAPLGEPGAEIAPANPAVPTANDEIVHPATTGNSGSSTTRSRWWWRVSG